MPEQFLPEKFYPKLEEPAGTEDNALRNEKEGRFDAAIAA